MLPGRLRWLAQKKADVTGSKAQEGEEGRVSVAANCSAPLSWPGQTQGGLVETWLIFIYY